MRVFINTLGSQGDVQPFLILGRALKEKGHTIMVCTSSRFKSEVLEHGLEYGYITSEAFALLDADKTILEDSIGLFGVVKNTLKLMKIAKPINQKMILNAWQAAKDFKPDLVIYHPKALGAVSIAEWFKVPAVMLSLIPMFAPTVEFPIMGMPNLKIGGCYNKLTYRLVLMGYSSYLKGLNQIRTQVMGLDKLAKNTGIISYRDGRLVPIIHAISPHVLSRPKDWPDVYTMSGYITETQQQSFTPSKALTDFLANGPPPVYVGFGSMSGANPKRLTQMIIKALCQAKVRGIIATGWGGLESLENLGNVDKIELPNHIMVIKNVSHAWLFPLMKAVVHHGGAGTTAAGLKAGCPTIICPFMGDQPFWGEQVAKLGVGVKLSSQKRLTVEELASAISRVTTDNQIQQAAKDLSQKIQSEDGLINAIRMIENIVAGHKIDC